MSTIEFAQLLIKNENYLKPFAVTFTKDNETAKDLLQETFYRAIANKEKYNVGTNMKAWLFTIMRNIFINDYRRKSKQKVVFDNTPNEVLLDSKQSVIENNAISNLQMKEVAKALHQLPEIFRNPFKLYFEGYHYNEIAEMLNEPLGTVKSRIHFARKLLKQQLSRF